MKRSILSLVIVVTLAFVVALAFVGWHMGDGQRSKWILVYKIDEQRTAWRPDKMDSLVAAISKRVNASWWNGIYVKGLPPDKVEIRMPPVSGRTALEKQAEAEDIRKIIRTTGALEFHYKLAIVLDNVLQTAPELQTAIGEQGRITGNFDQQEVNDLVEIINAGSLPAALEPTPVRDTIIDGAASK